MGINQTYEETRDAIRNIIQPIGVQHEADLTSAEIGELWDSYTYYSMLTCVFKYFQKSAQDNNDNDVVSLLSGVLKSFDTRLKWITDTFNRENQIVPTAFSKNDVNIDTPQLYSNPYILHYLKSMISCSLATHSLNISKATRTDVR